MRRLRSLNIEGMKWMESFTTFSPFRWNTLGVRECFAPNRLDVRISCFRVEDMLQIEDCLWSD